MLYDNSLDTTECYDNQTINLFVVYSAIFKSNYIYKLWYKVLNIQIYEIHTGIKLFFRIKKKT